MPSVSIIAYQGVDDLDFFGALSVLSKACNVMQEAEISLNITSQEQRLITSSGIGIDAGEYWVPVAHAASNDMLVIPGGAGALAASESAIFDDYLLRARATGALFYTICSGALLLKGAGLLKNRQVAMHHKKHALLKDAGCQNILTGFVKDRWLTSIGGDRSSSCKSSDIALKLISDISAVAAAHVKERMELTTGRNLKTLAEVPV